MKPPPATEPSAIFNAAQFSLWFRLTGLGVLCWLGAAPVHAHDPFEITTIARLRPGTVELEITMARSTALAVASGKPEAPTFDPREFEKFRPQFEAGAPRIFSLSMDGVALRMRSVRVVLGRENDVEFHAVYPRPVGRSLLLEAPHIQGLPQGYGATLIVQGESGTPLATKLLMGADLRLEVPMPASAGQPAATPATAGLFASFFRLGVVHIITGYDHLLFLVGLLVVCRRLRSMVVIVTCFMVAHSITLALAALGLVRVPAALIEPLIAASILFVGVENLLRAGEPKGRGVLTFGFGLLHGFGFAGALQAAGLGAPGAPLALPLFAFNLGVELGQLAVIAMLLPVLMKLSDRPAFDRVIRPALSALVALAGAGWLLQRTLFS